MPTIEQLREQIQNIDHDIIRFIALRQDLCKKMGALKRKAGKQIIDLEQEKRILSIMNLYQMNIP